MMTLIDSNETVLSRGYSKWIVHSIEQVAEERGIELETGVKVKSYDDATQTLHMESKTGGGVQLQADLVVLAAGAASHDWVAANTNLAVDGRGFIRVNEWLQCANHKNVFAAGDCASLDEFDGMFPPKAGVYAVREGPIIVKNLTTLLQTPKTEWNDCSLTEYKPQGEFLSLLCLGDGTALGAKWGIPMRGKWVWKLKDHIDLKFMRLFDPSVTPPPHKTHHATEAQAKAEVQAATEPRPVPSVEEVCLRVKIDGVFVPLSCSLSFFRALAFLDRHEMFGLEIFSPA
eukprot:m.70650 g.70650  ORF g.70650 m.70650 type:complete len:287 (+) comp12264_c0_seq9:267-1127(+)